MASGGVVVADVMADVIAVALCEVVLSRTRNHRRDQCLVSGGAISNAHAPANESSADDQTPSSNALKMRRS